MKKEQEDMDLIKNKTTIDNEIEIRLHKENEDKTKSKIIMKLHEDATEIEKEGICLMIMGSKVKTYEKFEFSQSLRIAANYLDGVAGGGG